MLWSQATEVYEVAIPKMRNSIKHHTHQQHEGPLAYHSLSAWSLQCSRICLRAPSRNKHMISRNIHHILSQHQYYQTHTSSQLRSYLLLSCISFSSATSTYMTSHQQVSSLSLAHCPRSLTLAVYMASIRSRHGNRCMNSASSITRSSG